MTPTCQTRIAEYITSSMTIAAVLDRMKGRYPKLTRRQINDEIKRAGLVVRQGRPPGQRSPNRAPAAKMRAGGKNNTEIARALGISPQAVGQLLADKGATK
jgi:DNA-binding NarL/FixJ family response regulator